MLKSDWKRSNYFSNLEKRFPHYFAYFAWFFVENFSAGIFSGKLTKNPICETSLLTLLDYYLEEKTEADPLVVFVYFEFVLVRMLVNPKMRYISSYFFEKGTFH